MNSQEIEIHSMFESEDDFNKDPEGYLVMIGCKKVAEFEDCYYDKGYAKCLGFIQGWFAHESEQMNDVLSQDELSEIMKSVVNENSTWDSFM